MNRILATALTWTRTSAMPWLRTSAPTWLRSVQPTTYAIVVIGWVLVWGLMESLPDAPMTKPISAGFALCTVVAVCLSVGWWFNTMVTDAHEEELAVQADEIADLRVHVEALWEVVLLEDGEVDTDLDTAADAIPADIPAAPVPAREPAPDTAPAPRVDLAGGLRLPTEDQQPQPEPDVVDDVDLALARFGLRTSEGRRTA